MLIEQLKLKIKDANIKVKAKEKAAKLIKEINESSPPSESSVPSVPLVPSVPSVPLFDSEAPTKLIIPHAIYDNNDKYVVVLLVTPVEESLNINIQSPQNIILTGQIPVQNRTYGKLICKENWIRDFEIEIVFNNDIDVNENAATTLEDNITVISFKKNNKTISIIFEQEEEDK
ncbi:hypothetical protein C2G38_181831 [Gigaspora rosea]|uniref:SHSP domain-containing protein n=1 Tax=Gigaspora rosea TaxID=44941 RepID=A0A397VXS3_9GLOM|nr:hypothetical protein C2G38_181831 [Gigaspora rosea]